jgi:hypothetical protein
MVPPLAVVAAGAPLLDEPPDLLPHAEATSANSMTVPTHIRDRFVTMSSSPS